MKIEAKKNDFIEKKNEIFQKSLLLPFNLNASIVETIGIFLLESIEKKFIR